MRRGMLTAARRPLAGLALAAVVLVAACGDSGDATKTTPAGAGTKQPASVTPIATAAAATTYPLTVTDMLGRSVTIAKKPVAIAALSPTTVEYVFAVGAVSKTRTSSVRFPIAAAGAKEIGPSYQPNLELIAAESPDLIVADSVSQPQLEDALEGLKVPVLFVGAQVFADAPKGLRLVGQVLDQQTKAEAEAKKIETTATTLAARLPATKPKVLVLNGTPDDFYAAKPESYVGDLVRLLGGENVAQGAPDVGRFPGYTKLSLETILTAKPDIVLSITAGPPGANTITASLSSNPAWAEVPAVISKHVSEINVELFLQAPGPRAGVALDTLAKLLYPDIRP